VCGWGVTFSGFVSKVRVEELDPLCFFDSEWCGVVEMEDKVRKELGKQGGV
jgi:hypothetical protein